MGLVPKKKNQEGNSKESVKKGLGTAKEKVGKVSKGWGGKIASSFEAVVPNTMHPGKSVGVRLFLIFFVAIMFFVLTIGILSYQMAKGTIKKNAESANLATIVQTSQKLDIVLDKYDESLQQMFLDQEMQDAIMEASLTNISDYDKFTVTNKMKDRLNNLTFSVKGVSAIYMLSEEGLVGDITSGNVNSTFLASARQQPWFEASKDTKKMWMNVPAEENAGVPVFRIIKSVNSVSSLKRFVLVEDIKLEVLTEYLKEVQLGEKSEIQLLTPDNVVVSSSIPGGEGKPTEIKMDKAGEKPSDAISTTDTEGKDVLAVYNTLKSTGWKLVGTVATAELVKDAQGILLTTYISAAVVAIITILIAIWMVKMIASPLVKLRNLMEEGAKGNLNVRMKLNTKDEIGQLTGSFNLMMEHITELVKQANHSAQDVLETAAELTDASNKTAMSAKEIAIATEEIANGATSLANEAERGSSLTDNIGQQMERVIHANKEMEDSANQVQKSSQLGTEYLNGLMDKTNTTVDMINALTEKVDALKASTSSVLKVLDVMQNITQQTNILSLNATIEAARAGAAGRGFMVVADEIRQLADQSRQSITMVGEITDSIQQEMNETVQALSDAGPLFQEQIASVKETSQIFVSVQDQMDGFIRHLETVTSSIYELNDAQNVLSEAMTNVSAVAQESSATSEQVASLSSEQQTVGDQLVQLSGKLENVSNGLKESLSKFTV
ncbi:methyl-accepting chemotaxis protein [Paenibacillus sp. DYY-L-2]|uniref:methyl-accepting chemotaxis protein n=1 Tax=Paenibacillus sp. DYY-L-2 TaxID=3447013 RepID=UPI003F500E1F